MVIEGRTKKYTYYARKGLTKKASAPSGAGIVRRKRINKKRIKKKIIDKEVVWRKLMKRKSFRESNADIRYLKFRRAMARLLR